MTTAVLAACLLAPQALPPLKVQGRNFVDPSGKPVLLKGCNVGNWLLIEFWMLGLPNPPRDQYTLEQTLTTRFGRDEDERLMDLYRSSWMTDRDWENIKSFGFNLVRVPFNYRLLEDDERPKVLRKDAWQWLDIAVDSARKHGLYVLLDLHGAQGGQTENDHTGRSGQNKLWGSAENQDRMTWLWTQVARRYRDNPTVIGYDTLNEPYGGKKDEIASLFAKTYTAIRSVDQEKEIFAHGQTDNFYFYGDPKEHGWHNVGFQMHFYPGLFGDTPGLKAAQRHLAREKAMQEHVLALNVPFIVGETNVVLQATGGPAMMRKIYDTHREYGWLTTMWSYKLVNPRGGVGSDYWGMVGNADPMRPVNFQTSSKEDIEAYFRSFATQRLVDYVPLKEALTSATPPVVEMPADNSRTVAPAEDQLGGWTATDIGGALKGGLQKHGESAFDLYGGGDDIWSSSDQFRFLHRSFTGDFKVQVTVEGIEDTAAYTKGGLMVRSGLADNASAGFLTVFSSAGTQIATRSTPRGNMEGVDGPRGRFPLQIGISRTGDTLTYWVNGKAVKEAKFVGPVEVGPVALSHSNAELTKISYRDLRAEGN